MGWTSHPVGYDGAGSVGRGTELESVREGGEGSEEGVLLQEEAEGPLFNRASQGRCNVASGSR